MPIYYVVSEDVRAPGAIWQEINQILFVVSCTLSDVQRLWEHECVPLVNQGRCIRAHIYLREMPNPFHAQAKQQ